LLLILLVNVTNGQVVFVHGTVYDKTQYFALAGVTVMGTSGVGTATDSTGHYEIHLKKTDSIYFSYQGKETARFPLKAINLAYPLDMSLMVTIDSLPLVIVRPRNGRNDSLENRREYQRVFEYDGGSALSGSGGLDLDYLFSGAKRRRMFAFQQRLIQEEHDKYVDRKFNKSLVRRITGLQGPALDSFMKVYRPSYELIVSFENDYDYLAYIRDWGRAFSDYWRREHPEYRQLNRGGGS
jgi:hypothetical protein